MPQIALKSGYGWIVILLNILMKNKKKQTRPLFIPKPESGDFPFDIQDVDAPEGKRIDYFRMYNCMKMVVEKLVTD